MERTPKYISWIAIGLTLLGVLFSSYSLYHFVAVNADLQAGKSICNLGESFNCDIIARSRHSVLFGVPLSSYGLWFYFSLFVLSCLSLTSLVSVGVFSGALYFFGLTSSLYSALLFYIAKYQIGTLCLVCMLMYAVNFGLLLLAALFASKRGAGQMAALLNGSGNVIRWPFVSAFLLRPEGITRSQGWTARIGLVATVCLLLWIGAAGVPLTYKALLALGRGEAKLERALNSWKAATPVDLKLSSGEGVSGDYRLGAQDAPVRIVEFLDYECPACRGVYSFMHSLLEDNPDTVQLILKNYPLDSRCNDEISGDFHTYACFAAELARCAGEQGQFWRVSDYLMQSEHLEGDLDLGSMKSVVLTELEGFGADKKGLQECLTSGRQMKKIQDDIRLANSLNISGTPTVYIDGRKLERFNADLIYAAIDSVLSKNAE